MGPPASVDAAGEALHLLDHGHGIAGIAQPLLDDGGADAVLVDDQYVQCARFHIPPCQRQGLRQMPPNGRENQAALRAKKMGQRKPRPMKCEGHKTSRGEQLMQRHWEPRLLAQS